MACKPGNFHPEPQPCEHPAWHQTLDTWAIPVVAAIAVSRDGCFDGYARVQRAPTGSRASIQTDGQNGRTRNALGDICHAVSVRQEHDGARIPRVQEGLVPPMPRYYMPDEPDPAVAQLQRAVKQGWGTAGGTEKDIGYACRLAWAATVEAGAILLAWSRRSKGWTVGLKSASIALAGTTHCPDAR